MNPTQTVQPTISAKDLANPVVQPKLTEPVQPTIPASLSGTISNVRNAGDQIIQAQTEEARQLKELRAQQAALAGEGTLSDLYNNLSKQYQMPANMRELQDVQLQLSENKTNSELTKSRIAGAGGQTYNQAVREISQEDREQAIRDAGLAARAAVLQGNIETASTLVNQAVQFAYQDRTLRNQNLINQINDLRGTVDNQTQQLLDAEQRKYEEDQAQIQRIQGAVDAAMASGAATSQDIAKLTSPNVSDEERLALAQSIAARGAAELRNLEIADRQASIRSSNASAALREQELKDVIAAGNDPAQVSDSLSQLNFLRDTVQRVIGGDVTDAEGNVIQSYDALYEGAAPAKFAEGFRQRFMGGDTTFSRLEAQVDTLRANMLTLATDPSIKQFFGPQMSDADVRLMTAAGTTLRPGSQSPEELKAEAMRIDDLLNRMQTAVKLGATGNTTSGNVITAPDGTLIEIVE